MMSTDFKVANSLPTYVFQGIADLKMAEIAKGHDVIDLSMGNPDGPLPDHVKKTITDSVNTPGSNGYCSSYGIMPLREAICTWYKGYYGVDLDPNSETVVCIGSKEGFSTLAKAAVNPGDKIVVPTPYFPIHRQDFVLVGAEVLHMSLPFGEGFFLKEAEFLAELEELVKAKKPQYVLLNFPHNPTSIVATQAFYEKAVEMAKKYEFYIISDMAYGALGFDGWKVPSILSVKGAKNVAVEAYTLSKTYNMAGLRVGFMSGNKDLVGAIKKLKTWLDYGMHESIQRGAVAALLGDQSCVQDNIDRYQRRRDYMSKAFKDAGWDIGKNSAGMFIWAKLPEQKMHMDSKEFFEDLLFKAHIAVTPGLSFGKGGEKYVRVALLVDEARVDEAARRIKEYLKS